MNDEPSFGQQIKSQHRERALSGFPTADINKLIPGDNEALSLLHGRIEMHLSGIAGYACSADQLGRRSEQDLLKARQFLSCSFFEKYEEYGELIGRITPVETAALFHEMELAEKNRLDLLQEVERLLGCA